MLRAAPAQLLAWCVALLANAAVIAVTLAPARLTTAALHHLYDAGHMLALGLLCALCVLAWQRFGSRRKGAASAALWAAAFVVDGVLLGSDFLPRASKLAGSGSTAPWLLLLTAVAASGIVVAMWIGRLLARPLFRWAMVFAAAQLLAANHFVLQRLYSGVHVQVAAVAAIAMGASLTGAKLPAWARDMSQRTRTGLLVVAALLAIVSVGVRPPNAVLTRMLSRSGSVLAPFVGRFHAWRAARKMRERYGADSAIERVDALPSRPLLVSDPVMVVVTIDALRADLLERDELAGKLPNLEKLRDSSVWFSQVRTPAPATIVALSSVFSGRYFSQLYWTSEDGKEPLANRDPAPRLPSLLSQHGVTTVTFYGSNWMDPDQGVVGTFDEHMRIELLPREKEDYLHADRQADAAIARLGKQGEGPLFIYMHWLEPHSPYDLATSVGSDFERYLAEVALCDAQIGRVMDALAEHGDRAVLIVGADHGEAFGEHNSHYHGVTVYDELVRVPLLVNAAGVKPAHIRTPVSLMDLGPTVLDLMATITPGSYMGQSLVPYLRGKRPALERPVVVDTGRHQRALIFEDGYKVIEDRHRGIVGLYDLRADPGELHNLADELPADTEVRLDTLRSYFARHELRREGYELPWRPP